MLQPCLKPLVVWKARDTLFPILAAASHSTLSKIKDYLHCTQTHQRMIHLAEHDLTLKLNYKHVINIFTIEKARQNH